MVNSPSYVSGVRPDSSAIEPTFGLPASGAVVVTSMVVASSAERAADAIWPVTGVSPTVTSWSSIVLGLR